MNSLPRIDGRYWLALMAASVFGTNTGDYVADKLKIGHLIGLPWLAGLLLVILLLDRLVPLKAPLWFWAAIITVRTAATNIGDGFQDFGLRFPISLPLVTVLFAGAAWLYTLRGGGVRADRTVRVDGTYWLCMILAGAWGTIAGDFTSFGATNPPLRPPLGTLVLCLPLALAFLAGSRERRLHPFTYWLTVGLIRAAGTCGGDALAHWLGGNSHDVTNSTAVTGAVFIGLVLLFYVFAPARAASANAAR